MLLFLVPLLPFPPSLIHSIGHSFIHSFILLRSCQSTNMSRADCAVLSALLTREGNRLQISVSEREQESFPEPFHSITIG